MKKIEISEEEIQKLIKDYSDDLLSSNHLSEKYKLPKKRVLQILKDNNVVMRNSGRLDLGGVKAANKRYYKNNRETRLEYFSKWQKENFEHRKEYLKEYRKNNLEKIKETKRNYEKTRKSNDPIYKLIGNFRTAIYTVLKENNLTKNNHYFEILGYTQMELVNHLEKLFNNGMTWENYGEWHVDHKLPITSFNFKDINDEEFKKCWSLVNLQPMWGYENISKSNKIFV
jgi:hypothetical protein